MGAVSATGPASEFFGSLGTLLFWLDFAALSLGELLF